MTKLAYLVACLAACRGRGSIDDEKACKAAAADVGAALAKLDISSTTIQPQRMTLVTRAELPATTWRTIPIVIMTSTEMSFQGSLVSAPELHDRLQAAHEKIAQDVAAGRVEAGHGDPFGLYFEIDAAVPWGRIAEATSAARTAGFAHLTFVFARTQRRVADRPPSAIDAELEAALNDTRIPSTAIADISRRLTARCPGLLLPGGRSERDRDFLAGVEPALVACKCAAEPASVRALFSELFRNPWPTTDLALELDDPGTPTAFDADAPWSEVGPQLHASTQPLSLQVRRPGAQP